MTPVAPVSGWQVAPPDSSKSHPAGMTALGDAVGAVTAGNGRLSLSAKPASLAAGFMPHATEPPATAKQGS